MGFSLEEKSSQYHWSVFTTNFCAQTGDKSSLQKKTHANDTEKCL